MSDDKYWLEGKFTLTDSEKMQEMNNLILEILRKTGTCRLTTKTVNGKEISVVAKPEPDKDGIVEFDYSVFEKIIRKGNYYNVNTGELVTPDRGYNHFGLTMNLILTVLEAYSETPCYFMSENDLGDVIGPAAVIEELTGKVLNFDKRARAFETLIYFRQFDKYKNFEYPFKEFPFDYCRVYRGQFTFTFFVLKEPIKAPEKAESKFDKDRQLAFGCLELLRLKKELKDEALTYIIKLMDMTLAERQEEVNKKHPLDFISKVAVFLPAAYLVKIYAEAFDIDFFTLWYRIGKKGYWDVAGSAEFVQDLKTPSSKHFLYKLYQMNNEDDFIGVWDNEEILFSNSMQENMAYYKKRYFEIEESNLSDFNTITNLINCIDDLQTLWNSDKYMDKDLLEEFIKNKDDINYKKAVYVLGVLINDEIEMFSEFTRQQVRQWILSKVNLSKCADKCWHYIDLLSNKKRRKELLDF